MAVFCLLLQGFTLSHHEQKKPPEPQTPQSCRTVLLYSPDGVSGDSVQAAETIPKGEASSSWQLFPSSDSGNDVKLFSQTELCTTQT